MDSSLRGKRACVVGLCSVFLLLAGHASMASPDPQRPTSLAQRIDESTWVKLEGNTRSEADALNDRGAVADSFWMEHMFLQLRRPPEKEQALGERYGLAQEDLATITGWLQSHGFTVNLVYPNGVVIDFSGAAGQVREAFRTEIHHLEVNGTKHIANMSDPQIPTALAAVVSAVSLNDFTDVYSTADLSDTTPARPSTTPPTAPPRPSRRIAVASGHSQSAVATGNYTITGNTAVTLSPTSLFFGIQLMATSSAQSTITLTNNSGSPLTISSITVAGANSNDFGVSHNCPISPSTVAAGNSCTLHATFTPQAAGPRKSSISINDNSGSGVQTILLTGVGTAISAAPSSLNFNSQQLGTPSTAQAITITNEGGTAVNLWQITFVGANAGDFSQSNTGTCGNSLGAGANCMVNVIFTPAAVGSRTASLLISDDGGGSPQVVTLAGTAQPPANVIFYDDFTGTTLSSAWTVISRYGEYSQDETECNVPQMVTVDNGLTITTEAQSATCGDYFTAPSTWPYITGDIQWTAFNFTYGTVEIEAKFPPIDTSLWPATWMLTASCQYTNPLTGSTGVTINGYSCPNFGQSSYQEIDMTECYGGPGGWCGFSVYNPNISEACNRISYSVDTNWHLFTTVWNTSSISQYMDGNLVTTCNQAMSGPMFLIIQTQTGGVGGTPDNAYLPATLQVSYVKVTQP